MRYRANFDGGGRALTLALHMKNLFSYYYIFPLYERGQAVHMKTIY